MEVEHDPARRIVAGPIAARRYRAVAAGDLQVFDSRDLRACGQALAQPRDSRADLLRRRVGDRRRARGVQFVEHLPDLRIQRLQPCGLCAQVVLVFELTIRRCVIQPAPPGGQD